MDRSAWSLFNLNQPQFKGRLKLSAFTTSIPTGYDVARHDAGVSRCGFFIDLQDRNSVQNRRLRTNAELNCEQQNYCRRKMHPLSPVRLVHLAHGCMITDKFTNSTR